MVRRQRRGRARSEVEVGRRLGVGDSGRGLAGGGRGGSRFGRIVDPAETAVERLQRSQQQAERGQAVSDDPEDEPGSVIPISCPPTRAAEQGAGEADAPERAGRGEAVTGRVGAPPKRNVPTGMAAISTTT